MISSPLTHTHTHTHTHTQSISSIPTTKLESIKKWLDSYGMVFFEHKQPLVWDKILKSIVADPASFEEAGGWAGFLGTEGTDEEEEEEDMSEFEPDSDEMSEEESSEDDSSDYTDSDDSEGTVDTGSEEESGKDWDELEVG